MGKVTSKLQVTVPKAIADQFGIRPGDSLQWLPAGDVIRLTPSRSQKPPSALSPEQRLELFDRATARQRRRETSLRRGSRR